MHLTDLEIVAACDPAGGKPTADGARSSILVLGRHKETDQRFVLDYWAQRCYTDTLTDQIFRLASKWKPRRFGVEAIAQQRLYLDSIIREGRERGVRTLFVPTNTSTRVHKERKILDTIAVELSKRRLFVQAGHHDLLEELEGYPTSATCDIIDTLAMAIALLAPMSSGDISMANTREEVYKRANRDRREAMKPSLLQFT